MIGLTTLVAIAAFPGPRYTHMVYNAAKFAISIIVFMRHGERYRRVW